MLGKVVDATIMQKYAVLDQTMHALRSQRIDRAFLDHLDSFHVGDHRKEFLPLFPARKDWEGSFFQASDTHAPTLYTRWFHPVGCWTRRVYSEICSMIAHVVTAKRLGYAE